MPARRRLALLVWILSITLFWAGAGPGSPAAAAPVPVLKVTDDQVPVPSGFTSVSWDCTACGVSSVRVRRVDIDTKATIDLITRAGLTGDRVPVSGFEVGGRYRLLLTSEDGARTFAQSTVVLGIEGARRAQVDDLLTAPGVTPNGLSADFAVRTRRPALVEIQVGTMPVFSSPGGLALTAAGVVSSESSRTPVSTLTVPLRGLLPATHYFWVVRATDTNLRVQTLSGEFTTKLRTVDLTIDRLHIDDDSDELSDGEIEFAYWLQESVIAHDAARDLGTGDDATTSAGRFRWLDGRPGTNAPIILSVEGLDDDGPLFPGPGTGICLGLMYTGVLSPVPSAGESSERGDCWDRARVHASVPVAPALRTDPEAQDLTGQARTSGGALKFTAFFTYQVRYV